MIEFAFSNFSDFISMGQYGGHVWLCYFLAFVVIKTNILLYRFKKKSVIEAIVQERQREEKRQQSLSEES